MFNHTLLSLIGNIVTTNASISPLNLLNVHKILFYTYSLAIYNFFLLTMSSEPYIKWSKWPWVSFLLLNCLPTRKKNERSENMKLIVKLLSLLPSAMVWKFISFLGVKLSVKIPIPIIIRKYMKFRFPFWVRFSVLAARKPTIIRGSPKWKSCQFLLQWLHGASKLG